MKLEGCSVATCYECLSCLPAAVLQQPLATEVSDDVALVARLVLEVRQLLLHVPTAGTRFSGGGAEIKQPHLQDHATSAPQATRFFPAAGSAALQLIQQAAFACDPAGVAFSDLVRCTSTQQVSRHRCRVCGRKHRSQ